MCKLHISRNRTTQLSPRLAVVSMFVSGPFMSKLMRYSKLTEVAAKTLMAWARHTNQAATMLYMVARPILGQGPSSSLGVGESRAIRLTVRTDGIDCISSDVSTTAGMAGRRVAAVMGVICCII